MADVAPEMRVVREAGLEEGANENWLVSLELLLASKIDEHICDVISCLLLLPVVKGCKN